MSEAQRRACFDALRRFKVRAGFTFRDEVKRGQLKDENVYFRLLEDLASIGGIAVAVATDAGFYAGVPRDQQRQVALIRAAAANQAPEAQRAGIALANAIEQLSPQLFVEIICRVELAWRAIQHSTLHYVRHFPATLGSFRWQADEKGMLQDAYGPLWAGVAKELSCRYPLQLLRGQNYSYLDRFSKQVPDDSTEGRWFDASSLCLDDLKFMDSHLSEGVQIADLIASGVRGCLRNRFADNLAAARLLGRLMRRTNAQDQAVLMMLFDDAAQPGVSASANAAVEVMNTFAGVLID